MQQSIDRHLAGTVKRRLQNNPAVAILGPRQRGKTTLAGQIVKKISQSVYLDLKIPLIWQNSLIPLPISVCTTRSWCVSTKSSGLLNFLHFFDVSLMNAQDLDISFEWRQDFMRTFLERDIGMLGFRMPPARLGRFWKMCAHSHGSLLNASKLANSLGVSSHTVRSYSVIHTGGYLPVCSQ